ncbi:hypothetical protein D3C76_1699690 [compost metagenome]
MITCWGFGPHNAAFSAFKPSFCPTISDKDDGLVFSERGLVREMERSFLSLSSSFLDSLSTADRLLCWLRSRFQKYNPITTAKNS